MYCILLLRDLGFSKVKLRGGGAPGSGVFKDTFGIPSSCGLHKYDPSVSKQLQINDTVVCKKVHTIGMYGVKWPYEK